MHPYCFRYCCILIYKLHGTFYSTEFELVERGGIVWRVVEMLMNVFPRRSNVDILSSPYPESNSYATEMPTLHVQDPKGRQSTPPRSIIRTRIQLLLQLLQTLLQPLLLPVLCQKRFHSLTDRSQFHSW